MDHAETTIIVAFFKTEITHKPKKLKLWCGAGLKGSTGTSICVPTAALSSESLSCFDVLSQTPPEGDWGSKGVFLMEKVE